MTGHRRIIGPLAGLLILAAGTGSLSAQDNLDIGKTGAQLFASNCAICHKSPRGLSKTGGIFGVDSFLREHYTASRQSAAVISAYLQSVDAVQPPERPRAVRARKPKADAKPSDSKPSDSKPADAKPADKPADSKPAGEKATQANASVPKPDRPAEAKSETKSETKPDAKPAAASDKKSD